MRVLLDTNLWSPIGDEDAAHELTRLADERDWLLMVAPSVLLEVARIPKEQHRRRKIAAMASGPRRRRLRTEAQLMGREVVDLVRRTRPDWLFTIPNVAAAAKLETFWTKTVWREALADSTRIHEFGSATEPDDALLTGQRRRRDDMVTAELKLGPLNQLMVTPDHAAQSDQGNAPTASLPRGWDSRPVAAWRAELWILYWYQLAVVPGRVVLTGEDRTMADWVEPWVDLSRMKLQPDRFTSMWLEEASATEVPRNWLRWAVSTVQTDQKITPGNARDEQHSAYLLDCDLFLSTDRGFVRALERVRKDSPFDFAEAHLVSGDRSVPTLERVRAALD